jgi:hypothetical protein
MTRLDDIRKLIQQYVKLINYNYDALKVAKGIKAKPDVINFIKESINQLKSLLQQYRDIYNKLRRNRPTKREEIWKRIVQVIFHKMFQG